MRSVRSCKQLVWGFGGCRFGTVGVCRVKGSTSDEQTIEFRTIATAVSSTSAYLMPRILYRYREEVSFKLKDKNPLTTYSEV